MNDTEEKVIHFLRVADANSKLNSICELTHHHFYNKESVLIAVPSPEAATYIDQLLWKHPKESFLPHVIAEESTQETVVISTHTVNINQAKILINLCPNIPNNCTDFVIIYDLLDLTHPTKEQLSLARQSSYSNLGFSIKVR